MANSRCRRRSAAVGAPEGGVAQLTKALANEWATHGINVNAIAPGYMETDNTAALRADLTRNRQITDHVLAVDGGWLGR
jgi:2-deoxy-D-gluconate 3-dehydrogenase